MSTGTVNISGTFSKDTREYNGLSRVHDQLVKDGLTRRVVVGVIETKFTKRDIAAGGVETPTVRFIAIEALDGQAAEAARDLLDAQYRERTGRQGSAVDADLISEAAEAGLIEDPPEQDPTAGPWPGDAEYQDGASR